MSKTVTLEVHQDKLARSSDLALDLIEQHVGGIISKILAETSKGLAPVYQHGGGGTLQASIQPFPSIREGNEVTCGFGTNVKYAIFQEYGTGYLSDNPKGGYSTKRYWRYESKRDGKWHTGYPMKPKRFVRDAIEMNDETIRQMLAGAFTEVLL